MKSKTTLIGGHVTNNAIAIGRNATANLDSVYVGSYVGRFSVSSLAYHRRVDGTLCLTNAEVQQFFDAGYEGTLRNCCLVHQFKGGCAEAGMLVYNAPGGILDRVIPNKQMLQTFISRDYIRRGPTLYEHSTKREYDRAVLTQGYGVKKWLQHLYAFDFSRKETARLLKQVEQSEDFAEWILAHYQILTVKPAAGHRGETYDSVRKVILEEIEM